MDKKYICIGMIGAGRATELHMDALKSFSGVPVRYKTIMARRAEQLEDAKVKYGFEKISFNYDEIINDAEIDVIDICTPPYLHEEMIVKALKAGKHVICEKPLTGYFGKAEDPKPIGDFVSKKIMYQNILESLERLKKVVEQSETKFMYAENFVYAPAILKAGEIIQKKKSKILYMKGEESLKGSSSPVAGEWDKTGGGTFIRTGAHPLSAVLWLKQQEAIARNETIYVESVQADMGRITPNLSEYDHRHIAARPHDVEDAGTAIITFSDGSRAVIIATDTLLGGSKNYVEIYCNDAAINCNLTMSNLMSTYFLDEEHLEDVYLSEMLPSKTGWNNPFLGDEFIRGYHGEMMDFMECIYYNREPRSNFMLGYNTVKIIYAAYLAAELGETVKIENMNLKDL